MHTIRERIDGSISVAEAGKKGGLATLRTRGRHYFVSLGRKGQTAMRLKYPGMAAQWGRLGGRPRKPNLEQMGEKARISKEGRMGPTPHSNASSPTNSKNHNMLCSARATHENSSYPTFRFGD